MRQSKTLRRLRNRQPVRMCSLGNFIPNYVRHAAHFGFDCIWLDLEHHQMSDRDVQGLLAFFHMYDIDCMVRPATLEKSRLYRYFEDGAAGLMIPHVSTVEKAKMLVDAVKFPPIGDRGLDGAGLDSDYYLQGGPDFPAQANQETFLVVQIETPQAVENAAAIAAVPGIDGLFVGPGDLGLRLRHNPVMTLDAAYERVAAAAKQHGKAWGCPAGTMQDLTRFHNMGAQLLAHGGEFMALMRMLEQSAKDLDEVYGGR